MAGGTPDNVHANQPSTPYHLVGAASTNGTLVASGARLLTWYFLSNSNAAPRYVKFYDKATSPTVGSDTPVLTLMIPGASSANIALGYPIQFVAGLGFGTTTGPTDGDSGAVGANELVVSLAYI